MIKNYLRVALRNIVRNRTYSFINIAGLAVGLGGFILVSIFIKNELSYDTFNTKADRIYRTVEIQDQPGIGKMNVAVTMGPLAPALNGYFSQIESSARIMPAPSSFCKIGDVGYYQKNVSFADPSTFDIFTFPFIEGDPKTALNGPYSLVVTQSVAKKFFGGSDPLGRTVSLDYGNGPNNYTVTGVMKDCPQNSHVYFEILGSYKSVENSIRWLNSWGSNGLATYVLLKKGITRESVEQGLPGFVDKVVPKDMWTHLQIFLQPLKEIHLHSGDIPYQAYNHNFGSTSTVYIFSIIAVFILLIGCINFMNLATARSTKRLKEIGMRKVLGSTRRNLIYQFLGESVIISLLAFMLSLLLAELAFPYFKSIFEERIIFTYRDSLSFLLELLGIAILVGIVAGSYPAFFLSRLQPAQSLKGLAISVTRRANFRKTLVVLQFSIAIALIVCTEIVSGQMSYVASMGLGFNRQQVLYIPLHSKNAVEKVGLLKTELLKNSDIMDVAAGSGLTGASGNDGTETVVGTNSQVQMDMTRSFIDYDYIKTMQMQIVQGRDFSRDIASDSSAVIINETAAHKFGWKNSIGKQFEGTPVGTVIGVVKDFNFASLHDKIGPLIMRIDPQRVEYMLVRLEPGKPREAVDFIGATWKRIIPTEPFDYSFLDQFVDEMYKTDIRTERIFNFFSSLAIFIACLGLFGLATYTAEQRTKEIGIRKVLGASVKGIVVLLAKDFLWLVTIASLVAVPIAYFVMSRWLQEFAYRINIGVLVFVAAGIVAVTIAFITMSFQAIKAATANPIESLHYE